MVGNGSLTIFYNTKLGYVLYDCEKELYFDINDYSWHPTADNLWVWNIETVLAAGGCSGVITKDDGVSGELELIIIW